MTTGNLAKSLDQIFGHEGGFSIMRGDPGNWTGGKIGVGELKGTKFGIAANSYPKLDIRNLKLEDAAAIYRADYASKVRFDDLPSGLDHAMLDYAINSGPSRAVKDLQRCLHVEADGVIGMVTLGAVRARPTGDLINALCDRRLAFLQKLRTWKTFGRGWSRRVKEVRAFALQLSKEK